MSALILIRREARGVTRPDIRHWRLARDREASDGEHCNGEKSVVTDNWGQTRLLTPE